MRNNNTQLVEARCQKCKGRLQLDDDFEDMEFVDGRTVICLICSKCDREYTGTFGLINIYETDEDEDDE